MTVGDTHNEVTDSTAGVIIQAGSIGSLVVPQAPAVPRQLPRDIPDFIGREAEVHRLRSLIETTGDSAGPVVISTTGQGGVGKTVLAMHVAHLVGDGFTGGQLYVNLRGFDGPEHIRQPSDVLAEFLRALGVDPAAVPKDHDERERLYRTRLAGKRTLILLDNAANEQQVRPLLPGSPTATVVITSRSRLAALEGVRSLPLDLMAHEDCLDLLTSLTSPERIQAEPEAAARVVVRCGRLPLAVRICGALLAFEPELTIAEFLVRLDDEQHRLDEMAIGDLDVRATFATSYRNALTERDQQAFRLLGILGAADFGSWVVAPLTGLAERQADAVVRKLREVCLLEPAAGRARYRLHDLVGLYAKGLPEESGEQAAAVLRLVRAYRELAAHALELYEPNGLRPFACPPDDLGGPYSAELELVREDPGRWVVTEAANLVGAVRLAHGYGLWDEAWQLCEVLVPLLEVPSLWAEWAQVTELGLDAARHSADPRAEPVMLQLTGELKIYTLDREAARDDLERSVELYRQQGLVLPQIAALIKLGETHRYLGDTDAALARLDEAVDLSLRHGHSLGEAYALSAYGGVQRVRGDLVGSIMSFRLALLTLRAARHQRQTGITLISLGDVHHLRAEWDDAMRCFDECGRIFHELGDVMWEANNQRHTGLVDLLCGRVDKALERFTAALEVFDRIGDERKKALIHWALGDLYAEQDDLASALDAYHRAEETFLRIKDRFCLANVVCAQALAQVKLGEKDAAAAALVRAREQAEHLDQDYLLSIVALGKARLGLRYDDLERAAEAAGFAAQRFRALGFPVWEGRALRAQGEAVLRTGDEQRGQAFLTEASELFALIQVPG
jgi:tetratricopeptide (TPR) repeat protein